MPIKLKREAYNSYKEIGEELQAANDSYKEYPAEDIGRKVVEKHPHIKVVPEWSDADWGDAAGRFGPDLWRTVKEGASGIKSIFTEEEGLGNVARGLKDIGVGAAGVLTEPTRGPIPTPLELLGKLDFASPEQKQKARRFAGELKRESFTPAGVSQRPALALSNLLMLMPQTWLKTLGQAGKLGKAGEIALRTASADPLEIAAMPVRAAAGAVRGTRNLARRTAGAVSTDEGSLSRDVAAAATGFTSGTGVTYMDALFDRARPSFNKVFRKVRRAKKADASDQMYRAHLEAVDSLNRQAGEAYEAATREAFGKRADFSGVQPDPGAGSLEKTGRMVPITETYVSIKGLKEDVHRIGEDLMGEWIQEKIPGQPGKAEWGFRFTDNSPIAREGSGRRILQEGLEELRNLPGDTLSAERLHFLRKRMDDTIGTISVTKGAVETGVSRNARHALSDARKAVSSVLENDPVIGSRYREAMQNYKNMVHLRNELYHRFKLRAGKIDNKGRIDPEGRHEAENSLFTAFSESHPRAGDLSVLDQLEAAVGRSDLVPSVMGIIARDLAGSGLVVKSEISSLSRSVFGVIGAAGLTGGDLSTFTLALGAAGGLVMFSPRLLTEAILSAGPRVSTVSNAMKKSINRLTGSMNRIDALTGGDLKRRALSEGWSVTVLMERIEEITGEDFGEEKSFLTDLKDVKSPIPE